MITKKNLKSTPRVRRILGIDPGSRIVGFACIDNSSCSGVHKGPSGFHVVDAGTLKADASLPVHERLALLHESLHSLVAELEPTECVIERAFCGANAATALKLGQARGALMIAVSRRSIPLHEITPAEVKKIIAGTGEADKNAVALAVETLLGIRRGKLSFDATDAIAIALAFGLGQIGNLGALVQKAQRPRRQGNFDFQKFVRL